MVIFKTDNPGLSYHFKYLFIISGVWLILLIYFLIFKGKFISEPFFYTVGTLILINLTKEFIRKRVYEIKFDFNKTEIIFLFRHLFSTPKQKTISFDDTTVDMIFSKWPRERITLYFFKKKSQVFEIKKSKDGFSIETLNAIFNEVEKLPGQQ